MLSYIAIWHSLGPSPKHLSALLWHTFYTPAAMVGTGNKNSVLPTSTGMLFYTQASMEGRAGKFWLESDWQFIDTLVYILTASNEWKE